MEFLKIFSIGDLLLFLYVHAFCMLHTRISAGKRYRVTILRKSPDMRDITWMAPSSFLTQCDKILLWYRGNCWFLKPFYWDSSKSKIFWVRFCVIELTKSLKLLCISHETLNGFFNKVSKYQQLAVLWLVLYCSKSTK